MKTLCFKPIMTACSVLALICICAAADDKAADTAKAKPAKTFVSDTDPAEYKDSERAARISRERDAVIIKMFETRTNLIKEDSKLQKLQKQIMALHKEMAIEIDSKKDMIILNQELRKLDRELESLPKK